MADQVSLKNVSLQQIDLCKLINRSPDVGDGWRQSGPSLWTNLILKVKHDDLMELDHDNMLVKLTNEGSILLQYIQ